MSELYQVHIERISGGKVAFRVTTVHPDAGPPPAQATFPMNLVLDVWSLLDRGLASLIDGSRLTAEEGRALARDSSYGPRLAELRRLSFGYNLDCTAEDIAELERRMNAGEPTEFRGLHIAGWSAGDHPYVMVSGDAKAFARAILPLVVGNGVDERENEATYEAWASGDADDADALPKARVWLELSDPSLLGHLRPGWRFDTASHF